jgi:hypothetical protein
VKNPEFLETETVFKLHSVSLHRFGGTEGVRDHGLIESAMGSAQTRSITATAIFTTSPLPTLFIWRRLRPFWME